MNRLKRLAPMVELAGTKEKQAARNFAWSQQKLDQARKSLINIRAFRENYSVLFCQTGNQGFCVQRLTEYRAFLNKINVAIGEQEKVVQSCEADFQIRKATWENARRQSLGVQKVIDKLKSANSRKERQREQSELDERSSRRGNGCKILLTI